MAEAERHTESFTVLVLSDIEARILRRVLTCIGGTAAGPRGLMDGIVDALGATGVDLAGNSEVRFQGSIIIEDDS